MLPEPTRQDHSRDEERFNAIKKEMNDFLDDFFEMLEETDDVDAMLTNSQEASLEVQAKLLKQLHVEPQFFLEKLFVKFPKTLPFLVRWLLVSAFVVLARMMIEQKQSWRYGLNGFPPGTVLVLDFVRLFSVGYGAWLAIQAAKSLFWQATITTNNSLSQKILQELDKFFSLRYPLLTGFLLAFMLFIARLQEWLLADNLLFEGTLVGVVFLLTPPYFILLIIAKLELSDINILTGSVRNFLMMYLLVIFIEISTSLLSSYIAVGMVLSPPFLISKIAEYLFWASQVIFTLMIYSLLAMKVMSPWNTEISGPKATFHRNVQFIRSEPILSLLIFLNVFMIVIHGIMIVMLF